MCENCGTNHDITGKSLCRAYATTCKACGKDNHWKRVYRSKPARKKQLRNKDDSSKYQGKPHTKPKQIDAIANDSKLAGVPPVTPALDQLYFHSLSINQLSKSTTQALVQVQVDLCHGAEPLWCKIDTGAEGNVIPVEEYKKLHPTSPSNATGIPTNLIPSNTVKLLMVVILSAILEPVF